MLSNARLSRMVLNQSNAVECWTQSNGVESVESVECCRVSRMVSNQSNTVKCRSLSNGVELVESVECCRVPD